MLSNPCNRSITLAIPVSILFDQLPLHEVKLIFEESRGLPKRPQNPGWLFSYARGLRHRRTHPHQLRRTGASV